MAFKDFISFLLRAGALMLRVDPPCFELMHCAITPCSPCRIFLGFSQAELPLLTVTTRGTPCLTSIRASVAEKVIPIQTQD